MKQAVLVLGMHRSGTSAIAGVAHLLGATAPATMMKPAPDNPTGFWESQAIAEANHQILSFLGCSFYDCLPLGPTSLQPDARAKAIAHCGNLLATEFGGASLFLLKDPRISVLMDVWLPIFASQDVTIAPLLALRHPAEVMASMWRRDHMPGDVIAPLWLHYTLESERHTRAHRRAVLFYDRLLQDWRGTLERVTQEAGIAWRVSFKAAEAAIGEFLRPQLRHHHAAPHRVTVGRPPVSDWIADAYDALRRIEAGERTAQLARLDRIRDQFAVWRARAPRVSLAAATGREPLPVR